MQYLKRIINFFYKKQLKKLIAIYLHLEIALPIAKSIVRALKPIKRKQNRQTKNANKHVRKNRDKKFLWYF